MKEKGVSNYVVLVNGKVDETAILQGGKYYYAVANGSEEGIYECYL